MRAWIGTSGYSYLDWVGSFYPAGTRPNRMFDYYVREFPLVELNFTYYRPPTPGMLVRLAERAPKGFQYLVKLPRTLSHEESPRDLLGFHSAVDAMSHYGCLAGLLCQLPQATHNLAPQRKWIERLAGELGSYHLAVEFRHRSWFKPEINKWLGALGLDLVSVDVPDIPNLYPRGLVQSSDRIYIRLHSRAEANWYAQDKDRYDYFYDDADLEQWIGALSGATGSAQTAFILFNNCMRSQAVENARRMQQLMQRMVPEMDLASPLVEAPPLSRQRSLFDRTD
jgi:uncharacterized protein YecE (DUF72 family)